jgi:RNA polymerase sigma-B factor
MSQADVKFNGVRLQALESKWLHQPLSAYDAKTKAKCQTDFLEAMTPYVHQVVKSMARRKNDPVEDLVQVGCIGVLKALEHYNPEKGASFKSYASYYVTGEIRRFLREHNLLLKAPRHLQELHFKFNSTIQSFTDKTGRSPTDAELLELLQCDSKDLNDLQHLERRHSLVRLDESPNDDMGEPLDTFLDDSELQTFPALQNDGGVTKTEDKLMLKEAIQRLRPELQEVVTLTFFEDLPQQRIAEVSGVSQMQVSRRLRKALQQLDVWLN